MKKYFFAVLIIFIALSNENQLMAQMQGIGIHFGAYDFFGPQSGNYFFTQQNYVVTGVDKANIGEPQILGNDTIKKNKLFWNPLVRVTYWYSLNSKFDINLGLSLADLQYPNSPKDTNLINLYEKNTGNNNDKFLTELDLRVNYNLNNKKKHLFSPYIFAGITASYHSIFFGADFPVGAGLNINLGKKSHSNVFLNLDASYKAALTTNDYNHFQYTGGIVYWFKPHYKVPVTNTDESGAPVVMISDMDHDGVPDSVDKCPTIAGLPEFNGCPDSDGDGIPDDEDECPLVAGLKQFNGCPDTDGDGIPDNKDKCPYQAGPADNGGCPIADRDHDGVPDNEDMCPDVPGTIANHGCPEIKKELHEMVSKAARDVFFDEGKTTLKKSSYASLTKIVNIMKENPGLYLSISGYTDNVGNKEFNKTLSDRRANVCKDYLISKGVSADHLSAKGYGEENPIGDNKTEAGRAKNRRTEMKLSSYKE